MSMRLAVYIFVLAIFHKWLTMSLQEIQVKDLIRSLFLMEFFIE